MKIVIAVFMAFIFWLCKVLKNTFHILIKRSPHQAFDNKYYPATVVCWTKYNQPTEMITADFSLYDEYKIVGFYVTTTDPPQKYLEIRDLNKDDISFLEKPVIFYNSLVYQEMEGLWTWKHA